MKKEEQYKEIMKNMERMSWRAYHLSKDCPRFVDTFET